MIDRLNALLHLDKPLLPGQYCPRSGGEQLTCRFDQGRYVRWLANVLRGDWGRSWTMQTGVPVLTIIWGRLGYTVLLMGLSTVLAIMLAVPIGIYSAVKQYSAADYLVTALAFFGQSMPTLSSSSSRHTDLTQSSLKRPNGCSRFSMLFLLFCQTAQPCLKLSWAVCRSDPNSVAVSCNWGLNVRCRISH